MTAPAAPLLPFGFAQRHGVFLSGEPGRARLYCRQGFHPSALTEVWRVTGRNWPLEVLPAEAFSGELARAYEQGARDAMKMVASLGDTLDLSSLAHWEPPTEDLLEQADDAPIIRLINALLAEAIRLNASDIHIETYDARLQVRFRIDGLLRSVVEPRRELAPLLISRIKVMARLDIAEKRLPQDGRMTVRLGGREVDVRVSTMPASHSERVVLRLLDKQAGRLDLDALGLTEDRQNQLLELLRRPHGILLVTGPTGSGKTTTLYAGLSAIHDNSRNILTVEDPIEYHLDGIGQTQVNTKAEMTFARGLRAMLRQDPDVVMVGEIRDRETADIAVQASLTGHLVLSTLHTNTAAGAVTRLQDMGIEPFLLASSLLGVIAQRLVRLLCRSCRQPDRPSPAEAELLGLTPDTEAPIWRAVGCPECGNSGYRGRTGIYEFLVVDDALRQLIHQRAEESAIARHAHGRAASIRRHGLQRVLQGETTMEEVVRVTQDD